VSCAHIGAEPANAELRPEEVGRYLSERLGQPTVIKRLRRNFPGVSRETYVVEAEADGRSESFVLRLDPAWGASVPSSLRQEYEVYRRLWGREIPVAEALWYAEGGAFAAGRPHMVRRLVEGSSIVPHLTEDSEKGKRLRKEISREHIRMLARLHRLDWRSLGFADLLPGPVEAHDALGHEYRRWRDLWTQMRTEPFPVVTEFLCWLGEQIPRDTPFVSLIKGNNGVGEEIFHDGRIVAMSDWELAALGDGALDIAFSQGTLRLHDYAEAIAYYGECVGARLSSERLAFATLLTRFKSMVCINGYLLRYYLLGRDWRPTSPAYGYVVVKLFERRLAGCIGKNVVDAAREYDDKPSSSIMSLRS
jgi:aminoglycoside phosphotransferase (APT) family kinase protein